MKPSIRIAAFTAALSFALSACVVPVSGSHSGHTPVYTPIVVGSNPEPTKPIVVNVVKQKAEDPNAPIYVCTLKPFMDEYRSENTNRGKAKLAVQKQCRAKVDAMFCEEKDIVCKVYD